MMATNEVPLTTCWGSSHLFGDSKRGMPLTTCSEVESPVRRLIRQEKRVRGLTHHSRRDPRNAKRIGRTVPDLFCTCAQEVGRSLVRRLRGFTPLGLQTQKKRHETRRLITHCTISCAGIREHRCTLAQPHVVIHTNIHTCMHAYMHTYMHTYIHT